MAGNVTTVGDEFSRDHCWLEVVLVAAVFAATVWMWSYAVENPVVLHLYYVPVVLTGFFHGAYRARLMATLCILTATTVFLPDLYELRGIGVPVGYFFAFLLWAATLILIAVLVGTLGDGSRETMAKLRQAHEKDTLTDVLTGAANRRAFEYELTRRLAEWNRCQTPLCLVLLDIDHFKSFNDRFGHQAGDTVLRAVANVLQQAVRETDLVARYGGEEFGIILPNATISDVNEIAEQARILIETSRFPHRGLKMRLTVSLGVAQVAVGEDMTSLVQRADAALYCSKEAGRNCVHFHDGDTCRHFGQGIATGQSREYGNNRTMATSSVPYSDGTTGLPTQKVFLEEFRRRTYETHRYGGQLTVALIAIDALVPEGDSDPQTRKNLLVTIARMTGTVLRETDLITRYDSNRLSVLLPRTPLKRALIALQRLSVDAAGFTGVQFPSLRYDVSIGAIELSGAESVGAALQRLEAALAAAIAETSGSVCYHDGKGTRLAEPTEIVSEGL